MGDSSDDEPTDHQKKELWKIFGENLADKSTKKAGVLWKVGGKWKSWKERYFILHGNCLSYFASADSPQPLGTLILEKCVVRPTVDEKRSCCFMIITNSPKNKRTEWIFDAANDADRDMWIDAIRAAADGTKETVEEKLFRLALEESQSGEDLTSVGASKSGSLRKGSSFFSSGTGDSRPGSGGESKTLGGMIRGVVSKKKRRYMEEGFDLDLTYVTDRVIAMGYPAEGTEGVYRNKMEEVVRFLDTKHLDHYRVYNLCGERSYNANKFRNRVATFPFDDHNVPPLDVLIDFCRDAEAWLRKDPENIVCIHCLAGKGRTGLVICALLLHCRKFETTEQAMGYFGIIRSENGVGVTNPCQRRYIKYYEMIVKKEFLGLLEHEIPKGPTISWVPLVERKLNKIRLVSGKDFVSRPTSYALSKNSRRFFHSKESGIGCFTSKEQEKEFMDFWCEKEVSGDIKVEFIDDAKGEVLFSFWFHATFVKGNSARIPRVEIDGAHKDKHKAKVGEDFAIDIIFDPGHRVFLSRPEDAPVTL